MKTIVAILNTLSLLPILLRIFEYKYRLKMQQIFNFNSQIKAVFESVNTKLSNSEKLFIPKVR